MRPSQIGQEICITKCIAHGGTYIKKLLDPHGGTYIKKLLDPHGPLL